MKKARGIEAGGVHLELGAISLHLLDVIGHLVDVSQLLLVLLQDTLRPLRVTDDHLHCLQPDRKSVV